MANFYTICEGFVLLCAGTMLAMERMSVLRGGKGGIVIQTGSLASLLTNGFTTIQEHVYTATKWAILGWTRSQAKHHTWWKMPSFPPTTQEGVRVMTVCPWVANTNIVDTVVSTMAEEDKWKLNTWLHKPIPTDEVAAAAEELILGGVSGDAVTVGPGIMYFYPDIQTQIFIFYKLCHYILSALGIASKNRAVTVQQLGITTVILLLCAGYIFHIILAFLGI